MKKQKRAARSAKGKSKSYLKKRLWKIFSLYIRNRDQWTCFTCGRKATGSGMHAGHFVPRSHSNTLFDEINVHAQCAKCNLWAGGEPHIYALRLINKYGKGEFERLVKRGRMLKQWTPKELEELIDVYQKHEL